MLSPGEQLDLRKFNRLRENAGDRGRDGGRFERFSLSNGYVAYVGNWRATPTPEVERAPLQPYNGIVHNGTIANDDELGVVAGEVDSMVLPRVLDRTNLWKFKKSIERIKGSFAIAAVTNDSIFLACNYKPIYIWEDGDGTIYFSSMERHFAGICGMWESPKKMPPYSVVDLLLNQTFFLERSWDKNAVVSASAGLDSTVVATSLVRNGWDVHLVHFLYGCKAERMEYDHVKRIAKELGVDVTFIPLNFRALGAHSSIMDGDDSTIGGAKEGAEYAIDWVPARNLVMLSAMTAFAESNGIHTIALGNNLEEAGAYPDNEEEFTYLFGKLLPYATQNGYQIDIISPVGNFMKREIVQMGLDFKAPFEHTWSCYRSSEIHCGECGPCFMRKEAFKRCGVKDPMFIQSWGDTYWEDCKDYERGE